MTTSHFRQYGNDRLAIVPQSPSHRASHHPRNCPTHRPHVRRPRTRVRDPLGRNSTGGAPRTDSPRPWSVVARPSQLLRKLAGYPRPERAGGGPAGKSGRIERSLSLMIEWNTGPRRAPARLVGLNKGEAHHALKRAINFHQRGELRDRTGEGQHYRVAGLNLLAAIIIYWNTLKLGDAVFARREAGLEISGTGGGLQGCPAGASAGEGGRCGLSCANGPLMRRR